MGNHLVHEAGELHRIAVAAMTPGDVEIVGNRGGVVAGLSAVAIGDSYTLQTDGVFELDALTAGVWADGDILYWDDTNNELTDIASTHKSIGIADGAKVNGTTTAKVDLNASVASTTI